MARKPRGVRPPAPREEVPADLTFEEDGSPRFPRNVRCSICGEFVETPRRNVFLIVEAEEGHPAWEADHRRCANRQQGKEDRKERSTENLMRDS